MPQISVPKRDDACASLAFPREIYFLGEPAISKFVRLPNIGDSRKTGSRAAAGVEIHPVLPSVTGSFCDVGEVSSCETLGHCGGRCAARGRRGACRRKADHRQSAVQDEAGQIRQAGQAAGHSAPDRAARPHHPAAPGGMRAGRFAAGRLRSRQYLPARLSPGHGACPRTPSARTGTGRRRRWFGPLDPGRRLWRGLWRRLRRRIFRRLLQRVERWRQRCRELDHDHRGRAGRRDRVDHHFHRRQFHLDLQRWQLDIELHG